MNSSRSFNSHRGCVNRDPRQGMSQIGVMNSPKDALDVLHPMSSARKVLTQESCSD
jgi:hypothetical protein